MPAEAIAAIQAEFYTSVSPDRVWRPGAVLGLWLWYVLPTLGWWYSRRLVTRRPPSVLVLYLSAGPPVVSFGLMWAEGRVPVAAIYVGVTLAAVTLVNSVVIGTKHVQAGPGAVRRWAVTGCTLTLIGFTLFFGTVPLLQQAQPTYGTQPDGLTALAVLICTWPAAAWITALIGPALRRTLRRAYEVASFLVVWGVLVSPYALAYAKPYWDASPLYRRPFFVGYAGFPIFLVAVCGVALQLTYLYRRGLAADWPRSVAEPMARLLLLCAVTMSLGNPSLRTLSMWGILSRSCVHRVCPFSCWCLSVPTQGLRGCVAYPLMSTLTS